MTTAVSETGRIVYDRPAIRRLRLEQGLSYEGLARRARLSVQGLRYLENGTIEPRVGTLARLAMALNVPVDAFFTVRARRRASRRLHDSLRRTG